MGFKFLLIQNKSFDNLRLSNFTTVHSKHCLKNFFRDPISHIYEKLYKQTQNRSRTLFISIYFLKLFLSIYFKDKSTSNVFKHFQEIAVRLLKTVADYSEIRFIFVIINVKVFKFKPVNGF